MLTDWLNEERLEHACTFCLGGERKSLSMFVHGLEHARTFSLSLSLRRAFVHAPAPFLSL
jgi:hypothetical protein